MSGFVSGTSVSDGARNNRIKIVFVYRQESARHLRFLERLKEASDVETTGLRGVDSDTINKLARLKPDILITGLVMPGVDGFELMRRIRNAKNLNPPPIICVFTPITSDVILREATLAGASIHINSMVSDEVAMHSLYDLFREIRQGGVLVDGKRVPRAVISAEVSKALISLGMNPSLRGFTMARDGIVLAVCDRTILNGITKRLYPLLAERNAVANRCVERVIRTAIEGTWEKGNMEVIDSLFGMSVNEYQGRPTNLEFLARMSDLIRSRL